MELDHSVTYYLAGPMTGYPEYNYPAFEVACLELRKLKLLIASPHEIPHDDGGVRGSLPYQAYIDAGLALMEQCQGMILLRGWAASSGVLTELRLAKERGFRVYYYQEGTATLIDMNRKGVKSDG